jgi:Uma2 family endonuclease
MSTAVAKKLMTAEEFFEFSHLEEKQYRNLELDKGEVVEMPRPGARHGVVCGNAGGILWNYTRQRRRGYVCAHDTGLLVEREPDTVRGPDVLLYLESKPYAELEIRYSEVLPDLAVEVLSPTDRWGAVTKKIGQLLERGVKMVWLIDPDARNISVYRPDKPPQVFEEGQELTGLDVLPDFRCPVSEFFFMPES